MASLASTEGSTLEDIEGEGNLIYTLMSVIENAIMQTSKWGKPGWDMLFYVAAGYEVNEASVEVKAPIYRMFYESMGGVLPCKYCRDSYIEFFDELDFDSYLDRPCGMIKFVYDMKNKVNEKLRKQERRALQLEYEKLSSSMSADNPEFWEKMRAASQRICYTKPSPPLKDVIENLARDKAKCSAEMKTCRDPLLFNEPNRRTRLRLWDVLDPYV